MRATLDQVAAWVSRFAAAKTDPLGIGYPRTNDPQVMGSQVTIGSANRCHYMRVSGGGTITKLRLYVAVTDAAGHLTLKVYRNTGSGLTAAPGKLVWTSGSVAVPAVGTSDFAIGSSLKITDGDFWFAVSADAATAQFGAISTLGFMQDGRHGYADTDFAAADPAPALTAGSNRLPVIVGVA